MQPLAQPPRKSDGRFDDWMFRLWKRISDTAGIAWSLVDKTGSNLTDIETRNHADLQNINTASYTHLTATNHTDLTDGGETLLHGHKWPMVSDTVDVGETVSVTANRQLLIAEEITNSGTIENSGEIYMVGEDNILPSNLVYTTDAGTVFLAPNGSAASLTNFPTFNQNTTGSSASCTGNAATVTNGVYTTGAGTVFLAPNGSAANLTNFPTLNQNTTGSSASCTGNAATVTNGIYRRASGRATGQTAAVASVSTYTVGGSDASFEVSANILITASSSFSFTVTCAYTDEGNTARTLTLTFFLVSGTFIVIATNTQGAVPYHGIPVHIRCKAGTSITIATTGTFTSVTYNVEGIIKQTA